MLGQVNDIQTEKGNLSVSRIAGGSADGINVNDIGVAPNGVAFAVEFSANCTATTGTVRFQVSDGQLTGNGDLQVNVSPNTPPQLGTYTDAAVKIGESAQFNPTQPPADSGGIIGFGVAIQPDSFTGSVTPQPSTGIINIVNAGPEGDYTITASVTDNCGAKTVREVNLQVIGDTIFIDGFETGS